MNVSLLQRIKVEIARDAGSFNMSFFQSYYQRECKTAFCIAGWALELESRDRGLEVPAKFGKRWRTLRGILDVDNSGEAGRLVLGLNSYQDALFYHDQWPEAFRERFYNAPNRAMEALVACELIDALIANPEIFETKED